MWPFEVIPYVVIAFQVVRVEGQVEFPIGDGSVVVRVDESLDSFRVHKFCWQHGVIIRMSDATIGHVGKPQILSQTERVVGEFQPGLVIAVVHWPVAEARVITHLVDRR